jgi:hypothetical protein
MIDVLILVYVFKTQFGFWVTVISFSSKHELGIAYNFINMILCCLEWAT